MRVAPSAVVTLLVAVGAIFVPTIGHAEDGPADDPAAALVERIRGLDAYAGDRPGEWAGQLDRHQARRLRAANDASSRAFHGLSTRDEWERFREEHVAALRESLGAWPAGPATLALHVTGRHAGEGFVVENVVYEARPDWWVTANRYLPAAPTAAMPGLLISHSHHTPKEHPELQEMGIAWARAGGVALVPDHLGHGERRQHPFATADGYPASFRVGRQDYFFRYDSAAQLYLAGESLMGWLAWDLMRGVDALLAMPGVDGERLALLGAVAGGGDPAAVVGALDERLAAVGPFNFGGPQPETAYPLPEDAEASFDYAGGGSWESTRNLAWSAEQGFLPWVIVGAVAPRGLIYGHEFSWDQARDPVWRRLETIYGWHDAADRLGSAYGRGLLSGELPEASHCTHIGRVQREGVDAALSAWFRMRFETSGTAPQFSKEELRCLTDEWTVRLRPLTLHAWLARYADELRASTRVAAGDAAARAEQLRTSLRRRLGPIEPQGPPRVLSTAGDPGDSDGVSVERIVLETEPGIATPVLLLSPAAKPSTGAVVYVSQQGTADALQERAEDLASLVAAGAAVVLVDLRGWGATSAEDGRTRTGGDTSRAATELMLGGTLLGARLRDLRAVVGHLRSHPEMSGIPFVLWGDSTAGVNEHDVRWVVPHGVDEEPLWAEPGAGLLALLAALFDADLHGAAATGIVAEFHGALAGPRVLLPLDALLPGWLTTGDVADLAAALAPRPVHLGGMVDAQNRPLTEAEARQALAEAAAAFERSGATPWLTVSEYRTPADEIIGMLRSP